MQQNELVQLKKYLQNSKYYYKSAYLISDNQLPLLPTTPTEITTPKPLKKRDYQSSPQPTTSTSGLKDKSTTRYIHNDKGVSSDSSSSSPGSPIIQLSITSVPE